MKVKVTFVYPPIPIRMYDWSAIDDDTYDGQGSPRGWGATKEEAIQDLLDQIGERNAEKAEVEVEPKEECTPPREEDKRPLN